MIIFLATELSQADPLKDFQSWFFGSVAVLFIGLLIYNLLEMKQAIKALTTKTSVHDTEIALIKQDKEADEDAARKHDQVIKQIDANFNRLNQTLALLTVERNPRTR